MQKKELIFKGNEKEVFATDNPNQVIFRYTDVTVAYNNIKHALSYKATSSRWWGRMSSSAAKLRLSPCRWWSATAW